LTKRKHGRPKIHKIKIDQRKDPKGYQKQYYTKRTKPMNYKLNSYMVDFSPPKKTPPKKKNEWSF
jgi:hypothetical protein